jgi:uncharacterized protein YndB with AHSA1/START domain
VSSYSRLTRIRPLFRNEGEKTKLTITALFQSKEDRDGMLKTGMKEGATETLGRLAELLETQE